MKFQAQLNAYIQQLDCLAKELSAASGISAATLSRYRSGERLPDPNAPVFGQLCQGIARLAAERGLTEVTEEAVRAAFFAAERVGHVAGDAEGAVLELREGVFVVNGGQVF